MKRLALFALCWTASGCGEAPEDDRNSGHSRNPNQFAVSRFDASEPDRDTDEGDDERSGAAEVCGPDTEAGTEERSEAGCPCLPYFVEPHETPATARTPDSVACPLAEVAPE